MPLPTALMALAALAVSGDPTPAPSATPPVEKLICRTDQALGSRLQQKRVCMTAAQWRAAARNDADDLDRRLRTTHTEAPGG